MARLETAGSVLVVDDDPDARAMLVEALAIANVHAIPCASAEEALAHAANEPPLLVVTDLHMDGMNGAQLARSLRALEPRPVVLALTGDAEVAMDVQRLFRALIVKPASPLDVAAMIVRFVRARPSRA